MKFPSLSLLRCLEYSLLFFILWKGGKALDTTWILASGASMLAMILSYQIFRRKESITFSTMQRSAMILSILFLALTILSFIFSKTQNYGFDEVLQTASYVLLLITLLCSPSLTASLQNKIPRTIAIGVLLACGVGVFLYCTQPLTRFVGTFFDYRFHTDYWPNAFAEFFLLAWPCALYAVYKIEQKLYTKKHLLRLVVLGFLCGCFFLTYSRGAFLSLILQMVALGALIGFLMKPSRSMITIMFRDAIAILFIALACFFAINAVRSQHFPVESVPEKSTI